MSLPTPRFKAVYYDDAKHPWSVIDDALRNQDNNPFCLWQTKSRKDADSQASALNKWWFTFINANAIPPAPDNPERKN